MSPAFDILILDDGELNEIRVAAEAVGATVHTDIDAPHTPVSWPLVVTSPRHLDALDATPVNLNAKRLAVVDRLSKTLRARMKRSRIDFFLRRPVHPEALRLLLLHCLYQGPERRQRRVAVGAAIRFRQGFRRGEGVLADLSDAGCRILCDDVLEMGARPLVFLPRPDDVGRSFYVRAEVVRVQKRLGRQEEMALHFRGLSRSARARIEELLLIYGEGPAVFLGAAPAPPRPEGGGVGAPRRDPRPQKLREGEKLRESEKLREGGEREERPEARGSAPPNLSPQEDPETLPIPLPVGEPRRFAPEAPSVSTLSEDPVASEPDRERRTEPRRHFDRSVVALDRTATRVLVGRDLSVGGMRVDSNEALTLHKSFRLSIHVRPGELPLILRARVIRDDGPDGMVLRFAPLPFPVQEQLRKSLRELPILATGGSGDPEGVLITEILDEELPEAVAGNWAR